MALADELRETTFSDRAAKGLANPFLRKAIPNATDHSRAAVLALFADADRDELRDLGSEIKGHAVANMHTLLPQLIDRLEANGARVHFAADATEARAIAVEIARRPTRGWRSRRSRCWPRRSS